MAEDIGGLEAEVRGNNNLRDGKCAVCVWIAARDDADEWDRLMALEDIQHKALGESMRSRGFTKSDHRIGSHRREKHRVA